MEWNYCILRSEKEALKMKFNHSIFKASFYNSMLRKDRWIYFCVQRAKRTRWCIHLTIAAMVPPPPIVPLPNWCSDACGGFFDSIQAPSVGILWENRKNIQICSIKKISDYTKLSKFVQRRPFFKIENLCRHGVVWSYRQTTAEETSHGTDGVPVPPADCGNPEYWETGIQGKRSWELWG